MIKDATLSPLGKTTQYVQTYDPTLLFPIARSESRASISALDLNQNQPLPFHGQDTWNAYELSWLNPKGKPQVAIARLIVPCTSTYLIESKSLKLYLNSLNQTVFENIDQLTQTITQDLSAAAQAPITMTLLPIAAQAILSQAPGTSLDNLDVSITNYTRQPDYLKITNTPPVTETLHTNLLKSNCPVTGQPDWATVIIEYQGTPIDHTGLLQYIISLRGEQEFHEHCVEQMFMDILTHCAPQSLTISAHYTRRGGIDINPLRTTNPTPNHNNQRLTRQ